MSRNRTCDNCQHPAHEPGWQWVMVGECEHCPECDELVRQRIEEDRKARPAQYVPVK